jgi:hypothetical protein
MDDQPTSDAEEKRRRFAANVAAYKEKLAAAKRAHPEITTWYGEVPPDEFVSRLVLQMTTEQAQTIREHGGRDTRALAAWCHENYISSWGVGWAVPDQLSVGRLLRQAAGWRLARDHLRQQAERQLREAAGRRPEEDRRRTQGRGRWSRRQLLRLVLRPARYLNPPIAGALSWWLVRAGRILPGGPLGGWAPTGAAILAACFTFLITSFVLLGFGMGADDEPPPSATRYLASQALWAFAALTAVLWFPPTALYKIIIGLHPRHRA